MGVQKDKKTYPAVQTSRSGFEESVGATRFISHFVGIWPYEKRTLFNKCYLAVPLIMIIGMLTIPQTRRAVICRRDLNAVIEVMSTGIIVEIIAIFKILGAVYNRPGLRKLIVKIAEDWDVTTGKEQLVMWKYARLSRLIVKLCIALTAGNHTAQLLRLLIISYIEIHRLPENETFIKPMFIKSDFYIDYQPTPIYHLLFVGQIIGCIYVNTTVTAYDGYFFFSMLHFSGQLYNLQVQIEELMDNQREKKCSFTEVLVPVIDRHRGLCRYTDLIEENFNKIFLFQMIFTCIFLTLQGYEFAMIVGEHDSRMLPNLLFITCWVSSNIVSIFMYCYVAEEIREQSERLFRSVFEIKWYDLPPKESKLLIIIMNQTKTPIEITVGKFVPFSLEYFCSIMKTSAGYLSVLLAMKDKL